MAPSTDFVIYLPLHRDTKIPARENTGNLEIWAKDRENTGDFVSSSCKFPDSKGTSKEYCNICRENFQ